MILTETNVRIMFDMCLYICLDTQNTSVPKVKSLIDQSQNYEGCVFVRPTLKLNSVDDDMKSLTAIS